MMWAALGLPVGLLLGLVVHRGDFCMHSAVREILGRQAGRNVRAYLVALGLQVALVNALAAEGWLLMTAPPIAPVSALVGGLVFGVGMVLTKG